MPDLQVSENDAGGLIPFSKCDHMPSIQVPQHASCIIITMITTTLTNGGAVPGGPLAATANARHGVRTDHADLAC
jgi:hypothetical protein